MSIQTCWIDHLGASRKELADVQFADPHTGGSLYLSLKQDDSGVYPWGEAHDQNPHTTMPGHKASQFHWRGRQLISQLPPPWWRS